MKLRATDIIDIRALEEGQALLGIKRRDGTRLPLGVYATEEKAEEVQLRLAVFSSQLMRTPQMDPLFIKPLDTDAQQE